MPAYHNAQHAYDTYLISVDDQFLASWQASLVVLRSDHDSLVTIISQMLELSCAHYVPEYSDSAPLLDYDDILRQPLKCVYMIEHARLVL